MPNARLPVLLDLPTPLTRRRLKLRRLSILAPSGLLIGLAMLLLLPQRKTDGGTPAVHLGPVIVAEPSTRTPLPIHVGPPELISQGGWLRIIGLPPLASLSEGNAIAPGAWKVPLERLAGLAITAPSGEGIRSNVSFALMAPTGTVLAERRSTLAVIPALHFSPVRGNLLSTEPSAIESACSDVATTVRHTANTPTRSSNQEDRRRAQEFVSLGDGRIGTGNVAAARAFYERAVRMGSATAAFALAATYDPNELVGGRFIGISADIQRARCLYAKARELVDEEAAFYLKRLEPTQPYEMRSDQSLALQSSLDRAHLQ